MHRFTPISPRLDLGPIFLVQKTLYCYPTSNERALDVESAFYVEMKGLFLINCGAQLKDGPGPRLRECCRQGLAEAVGIGRNKIHQTWGPPFSLAL